ncbi:uncharacterized protein A4U43_UnF7650 [Asparagus officinalis]|uniref:Uncharacterized protein n=1 Tax=Asparagus officinalis TaxID=4686 RepID=A0A1R3L648_ASPOF|nr:uncharacterized protein A4U43_UnF7650 [Asparagus officinalis]
MQSGVRRIMLESGISVYEMIQMQVIDTLVRQAAMVVKCMLLMYYKNSRGRNYRKQVQSFLAALKALSRKEVNYGSHATTEQWSGYVSCEQHTSQHRLNRSLDMHMIDEVISQAQATRSVLGAQRALFGDVQGKVKHLGEKFPIIRGLLGGNQRSTTTYIGDEIGDETSSLTKRLVTRSTTKSELRSETMRSKNGEEISDELSDEIDEFRPWRSLRANEEGDFRKGDELSERERGIFGKAVRNK